MNTAKPRGPLAFINWIMGSIRRKLTLFVVMVCLVLISFVWVAVIQLLEPAYREWIRSDMEHTMRGVVAVLDKALQDGLAIERIAYDEQSSTWKLTLTTDVMQRLDAAVNSGQLNIDNRSIDIANAQYSNIYSMDQIYNSVLHPFTQNPMTNRTERDANSKLAITLRTLVLGSGTYYEAGPKTPMVMGMATQNGQYSVLVASNVEQIPQAVRVLQRLMLPVSLTFILIAVLMAWLFSRWFTRPLHNISAAAQEMAKGNYDVQVTLSGNDEITMLGRDFNRMATEVKRSSELQRDLIANVSHDLRTPLTLIKGYAETVRDLTGDEPAVRTEQLNVIVDESDRLNALVGKVLELSRMSSGNEKPEPIRFDLTQLCDEVGYRYEMICGTNGGHFHFTEEGPCDIVADPALIERALHNLLGNALNHMGDGGTMGLRVLKTTHNTVRVEVYDCGAGVRPEDLPYLFDKYYRSRSDAGKPGTGLGLSITKAIFLAHKFEYGVESTLGEGATFWFEAPLAGLNSISQ